MHRIIKSLFPDGTPWNFAKSDKFIDGLGLSFDTVKTHLSALANDRNPYTTTKLDTLEREYGIIKNDSLSESVRREHLASVMYARRSKGDLDFLQGKLHKAGFTDLYVYDNAPAVDPSDLTDGTAMIYCGDTLAQCGEPNALCAYFKGEVIVNGDIYSFKIDYITLCGEALAQCGEATALAGNFSGITKVLKEYSFPPPGVPAGWIFHEDFVSASSVAANGGTVYGSPEINNGATFDANGEYILYTQSDTLTEFSIVCEADVISRQSNFYQTFVLRGTGAGYYSFGMYGLNEKLFLRSGGGNLYSTASASEGHHTWAATVDTSGNINFYEDGVKLGDTVPGFTFGTLNSNLYVGGHVANALYVNGTMYDLRIYDSELTAQEVADYGESDEVSAWWSLCFFVGGEATRDSVTNEITKIEFVQIPGAQREFLKRLILKCKPLHSWCGLVVNWV